MRDEAVTGVESDDHELEAFVVRLGGAMVVAGDSIDSVHTTLEEAADSYGRDDLRFFVLPTGLFVESGGVDSARLKLSVTKRRDHLRLDQIAALYELVQAAKRAEITPHEGMQELDRIDGLPAPLHLAVRVIGHGVLTAGLSLLLQPTLPGLAAAFGLGLVVGLLKVPRLATLDLIFPVVAAFVVALIVFVLAETTGVGDNPIRTLIAPLATFLPGGMLTIATVELAAGEVISGASRLVNGFVRLGLLAFGIIAAASLVGVSSSALADQPFSRMGWWAPWCGVFLVALGNYLHYSAPTRTVPWILLVLLVAYGGQTVGGAVFSPELSGFFGAFVMTPLVLWIDSRPYGAPSMVTFLPGFWLLVPGALGLIGITEIVSSNGMTGSQELSTTLTTIGSIALGVLIGSATYRTTTAGVAKVVTTLPGH